MHRWQGHRSRSRCPQAQDSRHHLNTPRRLLHLPSAAARLYHNTMLCMKSLKDEPGLRRWAPKGAAGCSCALLTRRAPPWGGCLRSIPAACGVPNAAARKARKQTKTSVSAACDAAQHMTAPRLWAVTPQRPATPRHSSKRHPFLHGCSHSTSSRHTLPCSQRRPHVMAPHCVAAAAHNGASSSLVRFRCVPSEGLHMPTGRLLGNHQTSTPQPSSELPAAALRQQDACGHTLAASGREAPSPAPCAITDRTILRHLCPLRRPPVVYSRRRSHLVCRAEMGPEEQREGAAEVRESGRLPLPVVRWQRQKAGRRGSLALWGH